MAGDSVEQAVDILTVLLLSISITGALLTFLTFALFSELRTYPMRLIMALCVCIFFGFLMFLISDAEAVALSGFCKGAAAIIHFFFIANFCWTLCIAFNFFQLIVKRNREAQRFELYYHIFSWSIPSICCICTGVTGSYGNVGGQVISGGSGDNFCYIINDIARFAAFFVPGLFIMAINTILFFFIAREIRETLVNAPKTDKQSKLKEYRVYMSIFISIGLSWFFGYLMFIIPSDNVASTVFLFLFTLTTPLQGFFLFIAYCCNFQALSRWLLLFGICMPPCYELGDDLRSSATNSAGRTYRTGGGTSTEGSSEMV